MMEMSDQAERGQRAARTQDLRQQQKHDRRGDPHSVEFEFLGGGRQRRGGARGDLAHVSRVPNRPIGRKAGISTSNT